MSKIPSSILVETPSNKTDGISNLLYYVHYVNHCTDPCDINELFTIHNTNDNNITIMKIATIPSLPSQWDVILIPLSFRLYTELIKRDYHVT